jgi:hypothetical protein
VLESEGWKVLRLRIFPHHCGRNCLIAFMFRGKSSLSTGLNVRAAFTRAADTAGTNAHTTFGENKMNEVVVEA